MKSIEDVDFDYLCKIPANKAHYLGYIVSFNIFPNQVECFIADNIPELAKANYSDVFDCDTDLYKKHSNVMKMESASATDVEEDKSSTGTDTETTECDSNDYH